MHPLDHTALALYFLLMIGIGVWSKRKVATTRDFYVAGGRMPWWLLGISHHMSGYSAVVFTAFAGVAYAYGITIYIWWAFGIAFGTFLGALFIAPRWARLRQRYGFESPLEYLAQRYGKPTQQTLAWAGTALNLVSNATKFAGMGIVLSVLSGIPLPWAIVICGAIGIFYSAIGGMWADVATDLTQFVVQFVAGVALLVVVLGELGGLSAIVGIWDRLPADRTNPFPDEYPLSYVLPYLVINFLSYSGGTWNLAQRFMSSPQGSDARKAALLSSAIYLLWPLVLFFPMWAAPLLLPDVENPNEVYALMAREYLPAGLVGLVLASVFAHTMAMTTSESNAISSVITRDVLPALSPRLATANPRVRLLAARLVTVGFSVSTVLIALNADRFGGVLTLILEWFGGLVGPMAIPMLFGMLPLFRRAGQVSAFLSIGGGLATFVVVKYALELSTAQITTYPVLVSLVLYGAAGLVGLLTRRERVEPVDSILEALSADEPSRPEATTPAKV